jgi:hypothetical protein
MQGSDHLGVVLGLLLVSFGITASGVWYARQVCGLLKRETGHLSRPEGFQDTCR